MTASESNLQHIREITRADVYKAGVHAATLTRTDSGVEFAYLPSWVADGGHPVATTLPVTTQPIVRPGGAVPAYFAGLLPEGRRLGTLRRAVKTSADDELSLLLAVGTDAVGDVQVVPAGELPADIPPRIAIESIGDISYAELLDELGIRAQRAALPGVQDKVSAAMINLPVARAGESWILKLNPAEYPHLVENEAFFLEAARRSRLTVPVSQVATDREGRAGLLIRRFDRVTVDGRQRQLAVEDGCQVSGRPPADKYLSSTDQAFAALARVCAARAVAGRELIRQLAFAYLTGNGDAHAKNFSVVQALAGEWHVSPAYDVPSTQPYGDTTMALTIGGRGGGSFGTADFVELGARLGVPERAVRKALAELVERAELWVPNLDDLPFEARRVAKLRRVIDDRRSRLCR